MNSTVVLLDERNCLPDTLYHKHHLNLANDNKWKVLSTALANSSFDWQNLNWSLEVDGNQSLTDGGRRSQKS